MLEWRTEAVGLAILRLVDDWLHTGPATLHVNPHAVTTVKEIIAHVATQDISRPYLARIVGAVEAIEKQPLIDITSPLEAYTTIYEGTDQQSQTGRTFHSLLARAKRLGDTQAIVTASFRLANLYKVSAKYDLADEYYFTALHYARKNNDHEQVFRTHIGILSLDVRRGNISVADTLCSDLAKQARSMSKNGLLSKALHSKASIATIAGEYTDAASLLKEALAIFPKNDIVAYEMMRGDLASILTSAGQIDEANRLHFALAVTSPLALIRWQSMMCLMLGAAISSNKIEFHNYYLALSITKLPPWHEVWYRCYAARGYKLFGNALLANEELKKLNIVAKRHGIDTSNLA